MKTLLNIIGILLFLSACSPDDSVLYTNLVAGKDIRMLELRADHQTLLPNGVAKMGFHVIAYGIKDFTDYIKDSTGYHEAVRCDTFVIPEDLIPEDLIRVYDEQGKVLAGNSFSTKEAGERTLKFYAEAGELQSDLFPIRIRELPDEDYEEYVYPVIFHMISQPASAGPTYSISTEELERQLERVNDVFNRKITTDPNGGNARISFRLAEYNPYGIKLGERGKNVVNLSEAMSLKSEEWIKYINENLVWDSRKYLNIWLIRYTDPQAALETFIAKPPTVILEGSEPIPGLQLQEVNSFKDGTSEEVGIIVNYREFLNPEYSSNKFELATAMGKYLGLLNTKIEFRGLNWVDGDTDYCPDTQYYSITAPDEVYKNNYYQDGVPVEYFTSFNIMDEYSRKNSISVDQAKRIRAVADRCPSRWSYRSSWAFTGTNE